MKGIRKHLEILRKIQRKKHHHLIHKLHKKYKISKRTLLYVKEYGPHTNVPKTIIKESIKILFLASIISSFGGFAIENIKEVFVVIIPLIILLPILNGMIGNYGTIISSRFSTLLHEGKAGKGIKGNKELTTLFAQVMTIALIFVVIATAIALTISFFIEGQMNSDVIYKIFFISLIDVLVLITILFFVAIAAGRYFFKKKEDPDNFLIPITTSIADLGNMIILVLLVLLFF